MSPTGRESDKFMLRLPDGMRDQIKTFAEANHRSMNAEIIERLEKSFEISAEGRAVLKLNSRNEEILGIRELLVDVILRLDEMGSNDDWLEDDKP